MDYSAKPCPSCLCTGIPPVQCSIPECGTDCKIDFSTKPCPTCMCPGVPPPQNSACMQPKDPGPCFARFERFFYNQQTGQCEKFIFGGCKGNENNFENKEDCENTCKTEKPPPSNSICQLSKEVGPCKARMRRFFFNHETRQCESFDYGGCKGNKNNFKTKEECETKCECGSTPSPPKCAKDEEYYGCVPNCHNTCDTYKNKGACPLYCMSGCFCKRGMVKNKDGKCVKTSECPSSNVPPTEKPPPTNPICQLPKKVGLCKAYIPRFFFNHETQQCESFIYGGCGGNKNNFRTKKKCETTCGSGTNPTCKSDEQYYSCVPNCHNTCSTYNKTDVACPDSCGPGCFCKEGMVKNDDGKCVSPSQCNTSQPPGSKECDEGEKYYDYCAPSCAGTCRAYNHPGIYHCPRCLPGCWCKEGLYKNSDGKCVSPDQCKDTNSTNTCGEDEVYRECGSACPPTCSNLGKNQICTQQCVEGCFCMEGLVRNAQGECVEPEECPEQGSGECGENEDYYDDCAPSCTGTCWAYNNPGIYNCPRCWPGCWCKEGFYKNSVGKCVPPDQCKETKPPNPHQCGKDEVYYKDCAPSCGGTCETYKKRDILNCRLCRPGCWCKKGFVKRKDGKCVPENQCEDTCGEDEVYRECGSACPPTCSNQGKNQICTQQCVTGCFCMEGLVRNDEGECVEPEDCPEQTCSEDEEYIPCGSSCPPTCSSRGKYQVCTKECVPGCFCKKGLVRNDEGECVEPEDCPTEPTNPPDTCDENEEYQECGSSCPATCSNLGMDQICTKECVSGCFCKKGLVRNDWNECVEPENCPQKSPENCGVNEKYYDECAPSCGGTCRTYNMSAVILCMPCAPGCWCIEGYVKNQEGECIPLEQCENPKRPNKLCGVNEIYYDKCAPSCRGSCDTYDTNIPCPRCGPGCWCKKGYLKNDMGKCVEIEDCKNKRKTCPLTQQYYECMPDCKNRCNPPDACAAVCKAGCFCKEGLVMRDDGKCVRKDLCKNECSGENEEIVSCAKPKSCNTCLIRGNCKLKRCYKGCDCKSGYYRDESGKCIPEAQCPGKISKCSGKNEEMCPCAKPEWCNTCGIRGNCKLKNCEPGCDCKKGYYRDDNGKCIPENQCPGTSTGPPKVSCSMPKCDDGCVIDYTTKPCPSCSCSDKSSKCSAENEEMVSCAKPKWCNTCDIRGNCKLKDCKPDCDCKRDYYRDDNGMCIPEDQCPGTSTGPPKVRCSIPKCKAGCRIDYSTKPCPSCNCSGDDSNSGNTSSMEYEIDSSEEYSYSEESFSSSQVSESGSMSQSSSGAQRSSRSQSGFGSWVSSSSSSNEIDSENISSTDSDVGYSTMSSSTSDWSSNTSSDYGNTSSSSSSGSKMWSSSTSSGSENSSVENIIDSSNDLSITEDMSSSKSESGYSTMSSDSESSSSDMSNDSKSSSSNSLSGSRTWSSNTSNSENISSEDDDYSSLTQDSDEFSLTQDTDGYSFIQEDGESSLTEETGESSLSQDTYESSLTQETDESSLTQETDESSFAEDTNESSLSQNSEWESGYSESSSGYDDWSSVVADDSENSSSKSESGSKIWSSKMTSDFEDDEFQEGDSESFYETNYEDDGNEFEENSSSWAE